MFAVYFRFFLVRQYIRAVYIVFCTAYQRYVLLDLRLGKLHTHGGKGGKVFGKQRGSCAYPRGKLADKRRALGGAAVVFDVIAVKYRARLSVRDAVQKRQAVSQRICLLYTSDAADE